MQHNPDRYTKGIMVVPSMAARQQGFGEMWGTITSPYPRDQIVSVRWQGKREIERWHVNLLDRADE